MNTEEVHALLENMRPLDADLRTRCDVRDGVVNLYIGQDVPGGRWSVVQTPGVGWFSVRIENKFTYDYVDEDADADETRSVLNHFVKLAATYARHGGKFSKKAWWRPPTLVISDESGEDTVFTPDLSKTFRSLRWSIDTWRTDH